MGVKNGLMWVFDDLESLPGYSQKKMFGCHAAYLEDRLVLVVADKKEPWYGVLVPTERTHHEALTKRWAVLKPHCVLGKWLYCSQSKTEFESLIEELIQAIAKRDPRLGVVGKKR